ncbi:MAG: hypothetical protein KAR84_00345 [Elusimicrobiales bacterium]|nr:hypothetical protein [Elusimicrobiales bacterium]
MSVIINGKFEKVGDTFSFQEIRELGSTSFIFQEEQVKDLLHVFLKKKDT